MAAVLDLPRAVVQSGEEAVAARLGSNLVSPVGERGRMAEPNSGSTVAYASPELYILPTPVGSAIIQPYLGTPVGSANSQPYFGTPVGSILFSHPFSGTPSPPTIEPSDSSYVPSDSPTSA